jgi:hypothetical protein
MQKTVKLENAIHAGVNDLMYDSSTAGRKLLVTPEQIQLSQTHAKEMAEGNYHRLNLPGSAVVRTIEEVYMNAYTGKMAEFGFSNYVTSKGEICSPVDCSVKPLGDWDDGYFFGGRDLITDKGAYNIKATKKGGVLYLVPCKAYTPKMLNALRKNTVVNCCVDPLTDTVHWFGNLSGEVVADRFEDQRKKSTFIKRGQKLKGNTTMKVDNYFIHGADFVLPPSFLSRYA